MGPGPWAHAMGLIVVVRLPLSELLCTLPVTILGLTLESAFKFQTLARDREHTQELPGAAPRH